MMVKRRPAASCSQEAVAKMARAKLGRLTDRKVGKAKALRYLRAAEGFCSWIAQQGCREAASWDELDVQAVCYLEFIWQEGKTKTLASHALSGIQHLLQTKRKLPGAWALFSVWQKLEPAQQIPPLPVVLLLALCQMAVEERKPARDGHVLAGRVPLLLQAFGIASGHRG